MNKENLNQGILNTKQHFEILDGLRGIAAPTVVIFHFLEWVFPDPGKNFIHLNNYEELVSFRSEEITHERSWCKLSKHRTLVGSIKVYSAVEIENCLKVGKN